MSCVHYKFKSAVNFETVTFDGMQISVADLKKAIIQQKKLGKLMENFDLQLTKPQSTEVYKDVDLIPKNSSIIVARIPVERAKQRSWRSSKGEDCPLPTYTEAKTMKMLRLHTNDCVTGGLEEEPTRVDMSTAHSAQKAAEAHERQRKAADLVNMAGSEEDKVKMMIQQSGKEYSSTNYIKPRYPVGPPPRTYLCHRCGQPGHFIQSCPNRDDAENMHRVKRSTGIPNSFMTPVLDPHAPGVLLTNSGQLAVPTIDAMAYKQGKKEKPPFVKSDSPDRKQEEKIIPGELLCPVCKDLLTDAVVAPCCGNSSCDECIRDSLLDSDDHVCPLCKETGISPDALIPNKFMRTAVNNFQNETGYTTVKRRNEQQEEAPIVAPTPKAVPRQPTPRQEPERQPSLIPAHLVGMPPQVIKAAQAEMASKEAHSHPDGRVYGGQRVEAYPSSAQVLPHGYMLQSQQPSNAVPSMAGYSTPYSVAHYQQPVIAHSVGMTMSHAVASLVHSSQANQGGHRPPVSTVYIDQHGVHHAMPMRQRVAHPGRPWLGPMTRGVLVQGRGLQRTMILRPSSVGARRLGPPPSSGDHRFPPPTQQDHRFQQPPSQVVGPISPNQIPGHTMSQGAPQGRAPSQQQTPPGMTAPVANVVRMPTQLHSSGPPPPQMVFNRGPPPTGQLPRLMGPDILMGPPPGFIPPLIPQTAANMPPPVPLTEEEFYREKERLLELERKKKSQESSAESSSTVSRKRADPMDDFEELLQKKSRPKAAATAPPYRSPRSRSPRSRSPRSFTKSRSRTRSRSLKKRSRTLSRSRTRSPIKSPLRRSRSMTRSLSRSRPFPRSKSRTRSPYAPRKKSFTPPRKYSRSRSPPPKRPRSRSFTRSPRPRSRTRSRSLPRRKATRSPMRSMTRSPLPKKRLPRSRSPPSRGRSPKRVPPKSPPSPRAKSRDRSRGPSQQARPRPPDAGAPRFTPPDRPRGGVYSSPLRHDNRGGAYYRYQEKYDPRWTEYYRMWQDWYDKYGTFAQGFPGSSYDHPGRTHSRPMPRSRSRSHSPRPPKRSRSPGESSRWRREKSPKRPRLEVKDRERPTRGRDEFRRSPVDKVKDRRKDVRGNARTEKDLRTNEAERASRAPVKSERRRDEDRREEPKRRSPDRIEGKSHDRVEVRGRSPERHDGRGRSRERDEVRGRSPERHDIRGRSPREKEDIRGRSREREVEARGRSRERDASRDQRRGKADAREDETDRGTIDSARGTIDASRPSIDSPRGANGSTRGAPSKTLWDKDDSGPQEEASCIPVIGGGTALSRPLAPTRPPFHANERDPVREREKEEPKREVKEEALPREPERRKLDEQVREASRIKQERPPEEQVWPAIKDDHSREVSDRASKERQVIKAEVPDPVDLKPDQQPRQEKPTSKEPLMDATGSKVAASSSKGSSSGSDRSSPRSRMAMIQPVPIKEVKAGKPTPKVKPALIDGADGVRSKRLEPTKKKKKITPSAEDILIANVPGASKWESNLSDSDADVPPPPSRQKGKERDRPTHLPRSILESAENAIRQKPRPSVVSSVCSPPPRSSIHRISTDSRPSPPPPPPHKPEPEKKMEKRHESTASSHSRRVVQGATSLSMKVTVSATPGTKESAKVAEKSVSESRKEESRKDASRRGEGDSQRSTEKVRSASSSARREEKKVDKGQSSGSKFKDEVSRRGGSIRDRKASVFMDEDKFEPDYNESGSSDYEESRATATATQVERSRRHESSSESEEVKAAKQKKRHKKQKKHKKHKSKSHKDEK